MVDKMRELVIKKLNYLLDLTDGEGIPRYFDCDESEYITDAEEIKTLTDEDLLDVFEACISFGG